MVEVAVVVAATDAVVVVYLLDVIRVDVIVASSADVVYLLDVIRVDVVGASSADVVHVMDVIRVDVIFVSYADVLVYLVHFLLLLLLLWMPVVLLLLLSLHFVSSSHGARFQCCVVTFLMRMLPLIEYTLVDIYIVYNLCCR